MAVVKDAVAGGAKPKVTVLPSGTRPRTGTAEVWARRSEAQESADEPSGSTPILAWPATVGQ
ncbi:hypothetical protein GCM10010302_57340 [Streptomyces polychromogenes]|uniref:Uncharacterized protein n=1 Tax=Streptomyces polychromogenes TaxID=67342 RepID=A0ABN0VM29_9ACTN